MSAAAALQTQDEYRNQLHVAEGYAKAVKRQAQARRAPMNAMLVEMRRMLLKIIRDGAVIRTDLREILQEQQDAHEEHKLQGLLWRLKDNTEGLRTIISYRPHMIRARRSVVLFWSDEIQDKLLDQLEDLEDLTETLALGLSATVHAEVDRCRSESGLSDAVVPA